MKQSMIIAIVALFMTACSGVKFQDQQTSSSLKRSGEAVEGMDVVESDLTELAEQEDSEDEFEFENEFEDENESEDESENAENESEDETEAGEELLVAEFLSRCDAFDPASVERAESIVINKSRGSRLIVHAENATLLDIRGAVYAAFQKAKPVEKIRGPLCFVGLGLNNVKATGELLNHRGPISIRSVNMSLIEKTRGTLVIKNSHVDVIRDHRGPIRLINSTVGAIENFRGPLEVDGVIQ